MLKVLTVKNISFDLGYKKILNNISFTILPGTHFILKGENGSGKTTLLKIIAGILKPKNGNITWNKVNINSEKELYQSLCVSYFGKYNAIKKYQTVHENLKFWSKINDTYELIRPALQYFQLESYLNTQCYKLSDGINKRVELAKLIILNRKLWLLDEPETFLDEKSKELLEKLLVIKSKEGGTIITATHNITKPTQNFTIDLKDFK